MSFFNESPGFVTFVLF